MYIHLFIMKTTIQKWGNSLAVRIPKQLIEALNLKEGNEVIVTESVKSIRIEPSAPRHKVLTKDSWKEFMVPTNGKGKERVSEIVDTLLYENTR